jgi:hypothetical protein
MRFEMTGQARQILDFLSTKPSTFSYDDLRNLTGVNDLGRLRGYLMTGLRRLRKQGVWYQSVRGIGYKLVDREDDKNPIQTQGLTRVRSKVKRLDKDQATVNVEALSRDGKLAYTFNSARIGRIMIATGREIAKEIERKIENQDLPIGKKKPKE